MRPRTDRRATVRAKLARLSAGQCVAYGAAFALCAALFLPTIVRDYAYGFAFTGGVYIPDAARKVSAREGEPVTQSFRLFNLRPRPLKVTLEPSCGCLVTSWSQRTVPAYSWTPLTATMRVEREGGQQHIAVRTDDPKKPFLFAFLVY